MKKTGIHRKIDELGRVVLPIELRKQLNWETRDTVEIMQDGDKVVLSKTNLSCLFCGEADAKQLVKFKDKDICNNCKSELGDDDVNSL